MPEVLSHLDVRHTRRDPVFVVGHGRSGTSLTVKLLRKYFHVGFGTESQFFVRYFDRLRHYDHLRTRRDLRRLVQDLARERCFERWNRRFGFRLDPDRVMRELSEPSYPGVIDAIFRQLAAHHGVERWGDKTPAYARHLPVLRLLFPRAQFVHIVRDGRDVALSTFRMPWGAKNAYAAAVDWVESLELVREFSSGLPADQWHEFQYETLLKDPGRVAAGLIDFLGIDDADGMLLRFVASRMGDDLWDANCGKWRTGMPPRQVGMFESVARGWLERFGYDVGAERRAAPGPVQRLVLRADNRVRRLAHAGHWRDQLHTVSMALDAVALPARRLMLRRP